MQKTARVLEQLQAADTALEQAGEQIERMDDTLDKSTSFGIPIVGLVFGPAAANALIAPQLQDSTTTIEVFCLTLAWALGVAGSTYLVLSASAGRLAWGTAITGTAFCLFASSFIASLIHVGAFKGEVDYTGGVIGVVTHSVSAAVSTWGWLGAAVGFASGVLVGRYAFRLVRSITQS